MKIDDRPDRLNGTGWGPDDLPPEGLTNGHYGNGKDNLWAEKAWDHPLEPFETLDFSQPLDPTPRQWAVPGWFPMGETCGLVGSGARGKTQLAVQLATACALGGGTNAWVGLPVQGMKAAALLCEDNAQDAAIRQIRINELYKCNHNDLKSTLLISPRRNAENNYLGMFDADVLHLTTLYFQTLEKLREFGAQLVVIDTREDVFFGNQNSPIHARRFVRGCTDRLARELGGIVIMLGHPSIRGINEHDMQSGSVQWEATQRARATITLPRAKEDDDDDKTLSISLVKANYGELESFKIQWRDGVLVRKPPPLEPPSWKAAGIRKVARETFLRLLKKHCDDREWVSNNPRSPLYGPKLFAAESGVALKDLVLALRDLRDSGQVQVEVYKISGRDSAKLILRQPSVDPAPE